MLRHKTGKIAYIGDAFREVNSSRFWAELVRGVQTQAAESQLEIVAIAPYDEELDLDLADKVDGIILGVTRGSYKLFEHILPKDMPCVSTVMPFPCCSAVVFDNYTGGELATNHLLSLGHRRIVFLMEMDNPHDTESILRRFKGYEAALRQKGIALDPNLIVDPNIPNIDSGGSKDIFYYQGRAVAREWFKDYLDHKHPTAIFAQNDPLAIGVIHGLKELGVRVPEDISVVGFDGMERYDDPSLTTIEVPVYDMGTSVVSALASQIKDYQNGEPIQIEEILMPVTLKNGNTTAAPKSN